MAHQVAEKLKDFYSTRGRKVPWEHDMIQGSPAKEPWKVWLPAINIACLTIAVSKHIQVCMCV